MTRHRTAPHPTDSNENSESGNLSSPVTGHGSLVFSWGVRVYHEDVDGSGRVYHANYLRFLERARTEWLRALGFEQTELAARHGVAFVVRSLSIEYEKPASFNDELTVTVKLAELKGGQILLEQTIARGGAALARAGVRVACVNTASLRPVRIPGGIAEALGRCIAGSPQDPR